MTCEIQLRRDLNDVSAYISCSETWIDIERLYGDLDN